MITVETIIQKWIKCHDKSRNNIVVRILPIAVTIRHCIVLKARSCLE